MSWQLRSGKTRVHRRFRKCKRCGNRNRRYWRVADYADGIDVVCTVCRSRQINARMKPSTRANIRKHKELHRRRAQEFVLAYLLEHPCERCGETNPVVLEFDHIRGKTTEISRMIANGNSPDAIIREIARTRVLCRNCHSIETARTRSYWIYGIVFGMQNGVARVRKTSAIRKMLKSVA